MKKHYNLYYFFYITLISLFSNNQALLSQEYRDTFTKKYNLSKDSAKAYSDKLIQTNKPNIKAFGFITKGYILTKEGDYDNAEELFSYGFDEINKIENLTSKLEEKLYALYYYSLHLLAKHNIKEASKEIAIGLQLSKKLNNAEMEIKFKNLIGRSFSLLGLGKEAITKGIETIESIKSLKFKLPVSFYNNELLRAYLNTGNRTISFFLKDSTKNKAYLDSTAYYLNTARQFIKESNFELNTIHKRQILNLNADILYYKNDFEQAIEYYNKTLKISESLNLKKRVYQIKFRLAESYFYMKKYKKAKNTFDELSLVDLNQYKLLKNTITIKYYYAQIYLNLGEIEKALKYTDTFNSQIDEYYKKMSSIKINVFTQNELNEKKEILDELFQEKKITNNLIVILLSIFLLFIALVFYIRNQRKKFKNKIKFLLENIENTKEKLIVTPKVNEIKAKKIILRLKKIEKQELYLSKDYSLNMVAKKINSNSSYVSQIINTYWKKSFVQYTNELRINYILLKLKEDKMYQKFTLLAIAKSTGYKSLSSFNKHFKVVAGISPKQYLQYLKANSKK